MAHPRLEETLLRGMIWTFIGAIFSFLFVVFSEYLRDVATMPLRILGATVGAAALTALFYGSMRLTVIVANFAFIAMVIYVAYQKPTHIPVEALIFIGAGLGFLVGGLYGWHDKHSHVFRADAKIVAGIYAGTLVAVFNIVPALLIGELPYPWSAMLITPLVVLLYVSKAHWFVDRCCNILPAAGDGALVGLGVGGITGLLFVIMAGNLDPALLGFAYHQDFVLRVHEVWGAPTAGSAAVCFVVGILRSMLKVRWYDL